MPPLHIDVDNRLPLARGLGSSAAAVVGGLAAAAVLHGGRWSRSDLFRLAVPLEGHPDNVAPAIFGGLTICSPQVGNGDGLDRPARFPGLSDVAVCLAVPAQRLPTAEARAVLPEQVPFADAVANVGAASLVVAAFATGRRQLLRTALQDRLHQPYRASLVPGLEQVMEAARRAGALGAVLSGAGPTVAAFVPAEERQTRQAVMTAMMQAFLENGMKASEVRGHSVGISSEGVRLLSVSQTAS